MASRVRMARDERVTLLLGDRQDTQSGSLAQVIRLDQHVVGHQPADQVIADAREALDVALAPRRIDGRGVLEQRGERGEGAAQHGRQGQAEGDLSPWPACGRVRSGSSDRSGAAPSR